MSEAIVVRDSYRAEQWTNIIRECQASGLTNIEYCRQNGISIKSYYYWLKKLRTLVVNSVEVPPIVRVENLGINESEMLHISYGRVRMDLPGNVNLEALKEILRSIIQR